MLNDCFTVSLLLQIWYSYFRSINNFFIQYSPDTKILRLNLSIKSWDPRNSRLEIIETLESTWCRCQWVPGRLFSLFAIRYNNDRFDFRGMFFTVFVILPWFMFLYSAVLVQDRHEPKYYVTNPKRLNLWFLILESWSFRNHFLLNRISSAFW